MNCNFKLFCHDQSVEITSDKKGVPFAYYLLSNCPSLDDTYSPTPYLFNGHLQTGYAAIFKRKSPHVIYERELLTLDDGGQLSLDWTVSQDRSFENTTTPILVVLHGLTGGSHESYIHGVLEKVLQGPQPYRAVVMNARGCGLTEITTPQTYSAGYTQDIRAALLHIQQKLPVGTPMVGIGFSLGSNILVKYLGEEKENTPLQAAISVGNPFDFLICANILDGNYFNRMIYSNALAKKSNRVIGRHLTMLKKHPELILEDVLTANTIRDFDRAYTSKMFGYTTVNNYYRDSSSASYIEHVRIPLVCINALDDPIALSVCIPWEEIKVNPYVLMMTTDYGGHLGWFQHFLSPSRWIDQPLAEIISALFKIKEVQVV
ncbi:Alpha/Beta hydrolase protein [Halteromyces radiatus]|uniref:Alpha/Beta hydrolase protein n=1 Tax=Halteromyces radiatus TaxID=101107 RepID=UPI00221FA5C4|nr:Alpha/Beta hydrolase protein [Halteromyces radiatus]KAI8096462.1 Alpha/Beta hydrolase protein [Halteromyces radiatus]